MSAPPPETVLQPSDASEVEELVREAAASARPLELRAGGTKARLGRPVPGAARVDLSRLAGVVTYEPEELILIARPGTRLREVEELLAGRGQQLAFEPPRWGEAATLGGTLGCGWAGPRRFRAGSVRDFVLGVELVDGRGRRLRPGGRVVKNVTGYDLWRATVGAFGTLGAVTEVCLKLWPRPATERTLVVSGLKPAAAAAALVAWSRRAEEISGLSVDAEGRLLARIEGSDRGVAQQVEGLIPEAPGSVEVLDAGDSSRLWAALREAEPYRPAPGEALWRIAVPPSEGSRGGLVAGLLRPAPQRPRLGRGAGVGGPAGGRRRRRRARRRAAARRRRVPSGHGAGGCQPPRLHTPEPRCRPRERHPQEHPRSPGALQPRPHVRRPMMRSPPSPDRLPEAR